MISSLLWELRLALRSLRHSPVYTIAAVTTLAFGIGANALAYSFASAVFLRPLPFPHDAELVGISATHRASNGDALDFAASPFDFLAYSSRARTLTGVGAIDSHAFTLMGPERPETVLGGVVSASMWTVLGTVPVAGRTFGADEDLPGSTVIVISEILQRHLFPGAPSAALGRSVVVDGQPRTVIGVLAAGYRPRMNPGDVWMPLGITAANANTGASTSTSHQLQLVARMRTGVTIEAARKDVIDVAAALAAEVPATHRDWGASVTGLRAKVGDSARAVTLTLTAAVGFLFLLTCANVTNLALVRVARRRANMSTRLALGASRFSIFRHQFLEALLLGLGGGALGVLLASVALGPAQRLLTSDNPLVASVSMDWRVMAMVCALSVAAGLLCCALPGLYGLNVTANSALSGGGRRQASGIRERRICRALMTLQVAAAAILLIGAFGAVMTLRNFGHADVGFDPTSLYAGSVTLPAARYPGLAERVAFVDQVPARIRVVPGMQSASATTSPFARGQSLQRMLTIDGIPSPDPFATELRRVDKEYFSVMGLHLLRGRAFESTDRADGVPVAIVNQSFARRYLVGREPLGMRVQSATTPWTTIVGVVPDVMDGGVGFDIGPMIYLPYAQSAAGSISFVIRTTAPAASVERIVRGAIGSVDSGEPLDALVPLPRLLTESLGDNRFKTLVLSVLSALAITIACIGIYGVTAYLIAERTREVAIRIALGARPRGIVHYFTLDAGRWIAAGAATGLAAAYALASLIGRRLPEVAAAGMGIYASTGALLIGVGLLATLIPTFRASRIAPADVLRSDL